MVATAGQDARRDPQPTAPRYEPLQECFAKPPADLDVKLDLDCGYVVVPEFHHRAGSREVRLGITRLRSGHGTSRSPLVMLSGGPGQVAIQSDLFRFFQAELLGGILASRDIIVMEQRGTRFTDTWLDCPALNAVAWTAYERSLSDEAATALGIEVLQECINEFKAKGVSLEAYNSLESAADVDAVREALGYDRIIYYGASYGSQLGQHVMRDFPGILEAVVLDGASALSRKSWVEDRALDAQWGIDNLTALCEADAKCTAVYDVPALVDAAMAVFANGPLPFTYTDSTKPSLNIQLEVTDRDLVDFIYGRQGDLIGVISFPATLERLLAAGADSVAQMLGSLKAADLLAGRDAPPSPMALLMHLAVVCSDDPVRSTDEVTLEGTGAYAARFGMMRAEEYVEYCSQIGVPELPDATDVNVATDVPVLLLSGDLDVATPTFRSREVADALPNATLVVFPGRTHVQIAGANICAARVMTQFVLDPKVRPDTSCAENGPLLGFVLPDGSSSRD
jgi:pimeloyl-ACP methyl ester carboxylesterase